jgi:hypothetical protein
MLSTVGIQPGDQVTLKKPHPCGGREWRVTRIGADLGLECLTCGRRVMLARDEVERRALSITRLGTSDTGAAVEETGK